MIDDIESVDPWKVRGVQVRGQADVERPRPLIASTRSERLLGPRLDACDIGSMASYKPRVPRDELRGSCTEVWTSAASPGCRARPASSGAVRRRVRGDDGPRPLLPVGHVIENGLPESTWLGYMEIEIREADVDEFTDLARDGGGAASLSAVTEGVLDRSPRHRELRRPNGFGDELRAALVDESRDVGRDRPAREAGTANFTPAEERVVASLSATLADGLRRAMLLTELTAADGADEPGAGLLVLADDGTISPRTPPPSCGSTSSGRIARPARCSPRHPDRRAAGAHPRRRPRSRAPASGRRRAAGCCCAGRCSATAPTRPRP